MSLFLSPKDRTRRLQRRALSHLRSPCSRPSPISGERPTPFREPLQFIVIAVMSVMSGTFPDANGVFYVTIKSWRVRGPSCHRHQENPKGKRPSTYHDGDD